MPAPQALLSRSHHADDEQPFSAADLSAIRLVALPEIGPPFDDDPAARASAVTGEADPAGGAIGAVAAPARKGPGALGASEAGPDGDWARQFARLLTEALSGARPARQILPWTSERARVQLRALMPLFGGGQRPRVLRVIATRPARDVIEMTVVAGIGARTRALAVRLERAEPPDRPAWLSQAAGRGRAAATRVRWLCTDIEAA
jgi:Family of unknown function (DUF6459)